MRPDGKCFSPTTAVRATTARIARRSAMAHGLNSSMLPVRGDRRLRAQCSESHIRARKGNAAADWTRSGTTATKTGPILWILAVPSLRVSTDLNERKFVDLDVYRRKRSGSSGWTRNRSRRAEREGRRFPQDRPRATNGSEAGVSGLHHWTRSRSSRPKDATA